MNSTVCTQLDIYFDRIQDNYNYFRSKLRPETKTLVIGKANFYGHGAIEMASVMERLKVDYIGVAFTQEAIELREAGVEIPIMLLTMGLDSKEYIIDYNLEPTIPNIDILKEFNRVVLNSRKESYPIHIKLDTGMHRVGFMERDLDELIEYLLANRQLKVVSIYSHLAASDDYAFDDFTREQIERFESMAKRIKDAIGEEPMLHILNSAGIERFPEYQYDMVRLGIGLYGYSPFPNPNIKPVAAYRSPIIQIRELIREDGTIGYGRRGKINVAKMKVATIPVGYADGINRKLGNGNIYFEVNGKRAYTVGSICMDLCMLDVTDIDVKVGDIVTIFGDDPSAEFLAQKLDTITYEILTSVSRRSKKVLIG